MSSTDARFRLPAPARSLLGAGLAAAVLLPAAATTWAAPAMAAGSATTVVHDATATLRVVVREAIDESNEAIEEPAALLELNGHRYPVTDSRLTKIAPNSTLRVDATITDGKLVLSDVTTVASPAPRATGSAGVGANGTTATHITKDLVILANWTAPDAMTQAAAQAEVGNDDAWYKEVSYGAEGIAATATPWVKIADPGPSCDEYAVVDTARAAAKAVGYDSAQYDRTLVYFPRSSCPWAGVSGIGADWSVFNGSLSTSMTTHEQGHELGFWHAHSYLCTDDSGGYIPMGNWCDVSDYGDPYDTMGKGGAVHYNAAEKDIAGWLPDGRLVNMTPGMSTTLAPLEQQAAAPQVAKLQVNDFRRYYIEYRQLQGVDSYLGYSGGTTHGTDGVQIRAVDPYNSGWDAGSLLLDMSPDANFYDATLKAGQSWTTPEGWVISVGAVTSAGAAVSVTTAPATPPSAPQSASASAGDASAYVRWYPPLNDGRSPITSYTVTSSPGGLTATVPASQWNATVNGLTNGTSYTFTVTATNAAGTSVPSSPTNAVTPQAAVPPTTYQEALFNLGGWKIVTDAAATDGSYRSAAVAKETSSFAFTGTAVTVLARGGTSSGKATVTIDGVAKGTVDLYRTTPTAISLPYTGLANKAHTIVVKVAGTKSASSTGTAVGIDGYQVGAVVTPDNSTTVTYSGWTGASNAAASGGTYRTSKTANTTTSYTFTGTAVSWVSATGPGYGKAQVLIDGVNRGTFDQYAAASTWQTSRAFTGLSNGQHTITIKALGTKNAASTGTAVIVDALVVTS